MPPAWRPTQSNTSNKEIAISMSRFNSETSAPQEPKRQRPGQASKSQKQDDQPGKPPHHETPFWEKVAGAVSLLLVLGVIGFLLYEAFQPQTAPEIVTEVQSITPQPGGYLVQFQASNRGRQTAASVLVEGALYDPAGSGEPIETAEATFDYIPDQSDRTGSLVFARDPRQYDLRLQVKGFMDP
jgi:uncharacterized protein (TIGR02588 family)